MIGSRIAVIIDNQHGRFLGLGHSWLLIAVGLGVLGFSALIGLNLRRTHLDRTEAWLTVARLNLLPGGDVERAAEALDQTVRLGDDEPSLKSQVSSDADTFTSGT